MSPPLESQPAGTLLLREVLAYAGATGPDLLDEALAEALSEVSVARCRMYALVDLARAESMRSPSRTILRCAR